MEILDSQIRRIQQVAEYRLAIRPLGTPGLGNILFGGLVLLGGIIDLDKPGLTSLQVPIGIAQLIIGFWQSRKRSLRGLVLNGIIQVTIGLWNIAAFLYERYQHDVSISMHWLIIGIVMTANGTRNLFKYSRLSRIFPEPPPEEDIALVRELIREVSGTSARTAHDVILLKLGDTFGLEKTWKGLLMENAALFVNGKYFLMCDRKEHVTISANRETVIFGDDSAGLRIGGRAYKIHIARKHLERYYDWKDS